MDRSSSSLLAGLLLAIFAVGGATAPTLHRVHHAHEQQFVQTTAPRCSHGALDEPVIEEGPLKTALGDCTLLARYSLDAMPLPAWQMGGLRREATRSTVALALYSSRIGGRPVIRGPPRG